MSVHPFPYKLYLVISEADCLGKTFWTLLNRLFLVVWMSFSFVKK